MDALTLHYARLVFGRSQPIYELHRDLCRAFGKRDAAGYLFRTDLDRIQRPARRVVLVQSRTPGDWAALGEKLASVETRERSWAVSRDQRYRFFLRANATRAKKARLHELAATSGEPFRAARGKRVALRGEAELVSWLERQGEAHGFHCVATGFAEEDGSVAVPAIRILAERDVDWRGKGKRGRHAGVDFEGLLIVADADKLVAAVDKGIGPGKAFGFGLLSLAQVS